MAPSPWSAAAEPNSTPPSPCDSSASSASHRRRCSPTFNTTPPQEPSMKPDRSEAMHHARRLDSERKRTLVLAATEAALHRGRQPGIAGIARDAGVGRKFIYDHPDLRAAIEHKLADATGHHAHDMIAAA